MNNNWNFFEPFFKTKEDPNALILMKTAFERLQLYGIKFSNVKGERLDQGDIMKQIEMVLEINNIE